MNNILLRPILTLAAVILLLCGSCTEQTVQKPNIIFILADDLGYMDLNSYAESTLGVPADKQFYETPNIDRLVSEGVAFSQAYVNQLCSPTRASLLTGKYASRLGFTTATPATNTYYNQNILPPPDDFYPHDVIYHGDKIDIEQALVNGTTNTAIPTGQAIDSGWDELTIAEALTDYYSAFIGKWHVGGHGAENYQPMDHNFHTIAYFDAGGSGYFNWQKGWANKNTQKFPDIPQEEMATGDPGNDEGEEYLTDDLTSRAISFIDEWSADKDKPFMLYFSHFAVHTPIQAKEKDVQYFENKPTKGWNGHDNATYASMIRSLDESVGKILDKLEEKQIAENTLVVFMSDNGGLDKELFPNNLVTKNTPLKGGKATLYEGGIRVPLVFRWKGKIEGNKWCNIPVDCNDIFPTFMEVAGKNPETYYDDIDGRSIMHLWGDLNNERKTYGRDTYFWHYPFNVIVKNPLDGYPLTPHSAIRKGDHKLIFDWYGRLGLYNIKEDISEDYNLASQMPDKTNELFDELVAYLEENVDKRYWPRINENYDPSREVRDIPFVNLYEAYKQNKDIVGSLAH